MVDDDFDFDIDSLSNEIDSENTPPRKRRRVVGPDKEGVDFEFDFSVDEEKSRGKAENNYIDESNYLGGYEELENISNDNKVKQLLEEEKEKATIGSGKKGKRIIEFNELNFDENEEALLKKDEEDEKDDADSKANDKKRGIFGNEFGVLEEDLEKIYEIQKQIKESKGETEEQTLHIEKFLSKPRIILLSRIAALALFIVIIFLSIGVIKKNKMLSSEKHIYLSQADTVSNESNFIYIDTPIELEDDTIKIKKIRLDSQELAIYFDEPIDTDRYTMHVLDSDLNIYYNTTDFNEQYDVSTDAKYTFEPLKQGTEKFSVRIENIETGYLAETVFTLDEPVKYPPTKFFYNSAPENEDMYVQNMVASSAYTKSAILATGDESEVQSINQDSMDSGNMYLEHMGATIPMNTYESDFVYFDEYGKALAIVENNPLSALSGDLTFGEDNIYTRIDVDDYIDIPSLNRGYRVTRETDDANVVVEGIYNYDGTVVIPMTGNRINAIPPNPKVIYSINDNGRYETQIVEEDTENYDKISVEMDATLYCTDDDGNEFEVPSVCKIGEEGTDVIFQDERLKDKNLNEMKIYVNNYATIAPGDERTVQIDNMRDNKRAVDEKFESVIKENFLSRLEYKAKEIPATHIEGFDDNMITNFELDDVYKPVDTSTSAYYTTNIEGYASEDNLYYAIVDETWTARDENNKIIGMKNRHKIIAEKQGSNYNIIYDKII